MASVTYETGMPNAFIVQTTSKAWKHVMKVDKLGNGDSCVQPYLLFDKIIAMFQVFRICNDSFSPATLRKQFLSGDKPKTTVEFVSL